MPSAREPLIWIDLEMTGLDPDRCHIIEMASLVTNPDLEMIAEGPQVVIHRSEEELETLSDWSREQFTRSGLLDRVRASTVSGAEAEAMTLAFLRETCTPHKSPLCGNSVHTDRAFLWRGMRSLHDFMHYRNIDVSSLKEVLRRWYPTRFRPPTKANSHEALTDIRESVAELRYYQKTTTVRRIETTVALSISTG